MLSVLISVTDIERRRIRSYLRPYNIQLIPRTRPFTMIERSVAWMVLEFVNAQQDYQESVNIGYDLGCAEVCRIPVIFIRNEQVLPPRISILDNIFLVDREKLIEFMDLFRVQFSEIKRVLEVAGNIDARSRLRSEALESISKSMASEGIIEEVEQYLKKKKKYI